MASTENAGKRSAGCTIRRLSVFVDRGANLNVRVTCLQETLQHALDQVTRAVATRTSLPALSNVLLVTDNGRLKIVASDLNIAITTWIGASIAEEGRLAVDARLLSDFVHTLPAGQV